MNRRNFFTLCFASAGAMVIGTLSNAGGFRLHLPQQARRTSLLIASARAMYDLCSALAAEYKKINPQTDFVIERGDSLQGLMAAKRGAIDLAGITRDLTSQEDDISTYNYLVARSSIAIVVNKKSAIKNLTQEQVRNIFTGVISNWKQVGGAEADINIVSRMRSSSTRQYVEEVVLNGGDFVSNALEVETTSALAEAVAANEFAIGYIAAKDSTNVADISYLRIDGVESTDITVLSGRYPYTHPFYFLLAGEQTKSKQDFIDFVRSAAGQAIVVKQGLVAVC